MTLAIILFIVRWFRTVRKERLRKQMERDGIDGPVYLKLRQEIIELKA